MLTKEDLIQLMYEDKISYYQYYYASYLIADGFDPSQMLVRYTDSRSEASQMAAEIREGKSEHDENTALAAQYKSKKIRATEVCLSETGAEIEVPIFKSQTPADWAAEFAYYNGIFDYTLKNNFVIAFNNRNEVCAVNYLNVGPNTPLHFDIKPLAVVLLHSYASYFVFVQHHPMASCAPSEEDVIFTQKLRDLASLIDCPILGSLILGKDGEYCDIEDMLLHGRDCENVEIKNVKDLYYSAVL